VPDPKVINDSGNVASTTRHTVRLRVAEVSSTENVNERSTCVSYSDTTVEDTLQNLSRFSIILDTVNEQELMLNSEKELDEFLAATKWRTFGFFRSMPRSSENLNSLGHVFLVVMFPMELYGNSKLTFELVA
jgi:hypothetical protein